MEVHDVLVVGAGPIGIEMAVALQRAGLSFVHLEAGQIGDTIGWYAPQTHFFSSPERIAICGVPLQTLDQTKATREEYLTYLRTVVQQFDLEIRTHERVVSLTPAPGQDEPFEVISEGGGGRRRWLARRVVLAIGDMHRPRRLGVPGEDFPHVSHYFAEPHTYFRKQVLIVGGKNSAVEAAIRCYRVGARVTLSYRREELDSKRIKFWLWPEIRALVRDGSIDFLPMTAVREIRGDRVLLERLGPFPEGQGDAIERPADFVLLLTGYEQDPTLYRQAGVRLVGEGFKPWYDETTMETNVPGLYVAGTGTAGTQLGGVSVFIETCHVHVERILAALTARSAPVQPAPRYELPES